MLKSLKKVEPRAELPSHEDLFAVLNAQRGKIASAEIFDPATNRFTLIGLMNSP